MKYLKIYEHSDWVFPSSKYKIGYGDWIDLLKKYPVDEPSEYEFESIQKLMGKISPNTKLSLEMNSYNKHNIRMIGSKRDVLIWKLEDEYWTILCSYRGKDEYFACDQIDEVLDLLNNIYSDETH